MFKEDFHIKKYEKTQIIMDFVNKHRGKMHVLQCSPSPEAGKQKENGISVHVNCA